MAKGQKAKKEIMDKIINSFPDAFIYDGKEVRINTMEDGELVQIKCTFTASKNIVSPGDENALPEVEKVGLTVQEVYSQPIKDTVVEPTAEEKENVRNLLRSLGM